MRRRPLRTVAAAAAPWADTAREMADGIDRAAEAMSAPHDAVAPALRDAFPGVDVAGCAPRVSDHVPPARLSRMGGTLGTSGLVVGEGGTPSDSATAVAARPETCDCIGSAGLSGLSG